MIKDRLIALIFRAAATIEALFGILVTCGVFGGASAGATMLMYYTVQSNIIVLGLFLFLTGKTAYDLAKFGRYGSASYAPRLEAMFMIAITLTMVVFWGMLAPTAGDAWGYIASFGNIAVHTITPILMILDYVFFTESPHLKKQDPWLCLAIPYAYFLFATIMGFSGAVTYTGFGDTVTRFPYFFIDFDLQGWFVALWVLLLTGVFVGLMYLLKYLDGKFKKPQLLPRPQKDASEPNSHS